LADTPQAEAVENVQGAALFDMPADAFKENRSELYPEMKRLMRPPLASPGVAEAMRESPEHASALLPDVEHFSAIDSMFSDFADEAAVARAPASAPPKEEPGFFERAFERIGQAAQADAEARKAQGEQIVNYAKFAVGTAAAKVGPQRELNDLNWLKLTGQLTDEQAILLDIRRAESKDNFGYKNYGYTGFWEKVPADVIAQVADFPNIALRHADEIATLSLAGGAYGMLVGGGPPGLIGGLITGGVAGSVAAMGIDSYRQTAADVYQELDTAVDDAGKPLAISEENKKYISHGVGIASGAIEALTDKLSINQIPAVKRLLNAKSVAEFLSKASNTPLKEALIGIGRTMAINGIQESSQEIVQLLGEEIGKSSVNNELAIANGVVSTWNKLRHDQPTRDRVEGAGVVGALSAAAIGGATTAVDAGVRAAVPTPQEKPFNQLRSDLLNPETTFTDLSGPRMRPEAEAALALKFQNVLDLSAKIAEASKLQGLDKSQATGLRARLLDNAGVKHFFLDKEELESFATDEKKALAIRNLIDESGVAAAQMNQPIKVEAGKFLEFHGDYPEISEYAKLRAEGPSPKGAKAWLESKRAAEAKRAEIRQKLEIGEKSPDERAYGAKLNLDASDEEIAAGLGTKEVAGAYLARLDVEDVAAQALPEGPERDAKLAQSAALRERVAKIKDSLPDDQNAKATLKQALEEPDPSNDVFGEADYLNQPLFSQVMEQVIPKAQAERIAKAQREARERIAGIVNDSANAEREGVVDIYREIATEARRQELMAEMESDPNLAVVDRFRAKDPEVFPSERFADASELTAAHRKPGFSVFAMDPKLLTPEQKEKYGKHPQLKKHKAFVGGGVSPDDAAFALGMGTGDNLLAMLARTPSREDIAKAKLESEKQSIAAKASRAVDLDHEAVTAAYHDLVALHLEEMKWLKSERWSAVKAGIKMVALPLPTAREIMRRARVAVEQTKVGDLKANPFRVAERKSNRRAVGAALKNDLPKAFANKEAAALNVALAAETLQAEKDVNATVRLAARFENDDVRLKLRKAGSLAAADELLDAYKLKFTRKKDLVEQGAYQKWVRSQVEQGISNPEIVDRLSDPRAALEDMTVEEARVVGDRLRQILHEADRKNALLAKFGEEAQTHEELVDKLHEISLANPDYDLSRTVPIQEKTRLQKLSAGFDDALAMLQNAEHILLAADNGVVGGLYNRSVIAPLKGRGKHAGRGEQGKFADMAKLKATFDEQVIAAIGEKEWADMRNEIVYAPEFAESVGLKNGRVSKGELFMMLLNLGNEGNASHLIDNMAEPGGFRTDRETVMKVLERELTHKHAVAAQRIMDIYASYYGRVVKMHEEMTGVTPEMVEATPIAFKGKVYPGGYYPRMYASEMNYEKILSRVKHAKAAKAGDKLEAMRDTFYADDMTRHRHTERRTGSDQPINLSMGSIGQGFEMIVHDLNYRQPIANALKILTDPRVAKDLTASVGVASYNVLVNSVIETSHSVQMENNALFDSAAWGERAMAQGRSGMAVGYIVGRVNSLLIQPTSMIYAVERMGAGGQKHLLHALKTIVEHPELISELYDFAGEINPAIYASRQGIDDNTRDVVSKRLPKKNLIPALAGLNNMIDKVNEAGFEALGHVDNVQKVITSVAAYRQFMAGDAKGHSRESVMVLAEAERDHQAKAYAASVTTLTLTAGGDLDRAPVQRKYKNMSMFFNDARNVVNNTLRQGREIRQNAKKGNYSQAVRGTFVAAMTMVMAKALTDVVRRNPTPFSEGGDDEDKVSYMSWLMTAPYDTIIGNVTFLRDAKQALDMSVFRRGRIELMTPAVKIATDVIKSLEIGWHFMDLVQGDRELTRADAKALAFTLSYARPIPVNALFDLYDRLGKPLLEEPYADQFARRFTVFKKAQGQLPESERVSEETMKMLEGMALEVAPPGALPEAASLDKENQRRKD
jgi:hypothetical protein